MSVIIPRLPRRNTKTERIKERQSLYQRSDYKKFAEYYKREHIWCEDCKAEGLYTCGEHLHHIQSPFEHGLSKMQQLQRLMDVNNVKFLCRYHHSLRHNTASKEQIEEHNQKLKRIQDEGNLERH